MSYFENVKSLLAHDYSVVIDGPDYYCHNEHQRFNPASTIKLYILYAALKAIDLSKLNIQDTIIIPDEEIVPGAGVIHLLSKRSYTIDDLLTLMVVYSDNTATNMMLDILSIDYVQNTVELLGLKETFVRRKLYHMIPGIFNASSSSDLNHVLHALYDGQLLTKETTAYGLRKMKKQQYKNIGKYLETCARCHNLLVKNTCTCGLYKGDVDPISVECYSKSGEITGHVHDACIIMINDQPIYITIMTANQINNHDTKEILGKIGLMTYQHYKEILC